jgi:hypothetical protein
MVGVEWSKTLGLVGPKLQNSQDEAGPKPFMLISDLVGDFEKKQRSVGRSTGVGVGHCLSSPRPRGAPNKTRQSACHVGTNQGARSSARIALLDEVSTLAARWFVAHLLQSVGGSHVDRRDRLLAASRAPSSPWPLVRGDITGPPCGQNLGERFHDISFSSETELARKNET